MFLVTGLTSESIVSRLPLPTGEHHVLNWSPRDFDPRGPAGPTAFWKVSDKVSEAGGYSAIMQDFLPPIDEHIAESDDEYEPGHSGDEDGDDDEPGLELEITGISWVTWTDD